LILQYVVLSIEEGCDPVNKIYYFNLSKLPNGLEGFRNENSLLPFVKLIDNFDAKYQPIANDDTVFTFLTNKDAPKYKLVRVDLKEPNTWTDVIQESEKDVLESAYAVNGNQLIVSYLSDVKYVLQVRDLETGSLQHQLPIDIGTVSEISARREDSVVFIGFTSFLTPGIIYQYNLNTQIPDMKIFREIVVPGFDRSEFHVNQVNDEG
jgi:prolyl oligopeptidase